MRNVNINISQVDSRILVKAGGKALPDIFSGYELKSSRCGEPELWLSMKGIIHVSALSVNLLATEDERGRGMQGFWFDLLRDIKKDLTDKGISEKEQEDIIQELKHVSLRKINLHGNMLNLQEKHISAVQIYYKEILGKYLAR